MAWCTNIHTKSSTNPTRWFDNEETPRNRAAFLYGREAGIFFVLQMLNKIHSFVKYADD